MTVPPPLPSKTQARGTNQGTRQTVSIRAASPPSSPTLTTAVGATVFVGVSAPAADSMATCRRRIPEVQTSNGYVRQSNVQTTQQHLQQQQQQHQAAHIVKIKINPDGDRNGRVISTVRLTLDGNTGHEVENGITCERSGRRNDGAVVISATNQVNEKHRGSAGAGEACVRISVVGGNTPERQDHASVNGGSNIGNNNNNNNYSKDNSDNSKGNKIERDMVQRGPAETVSASVLNNRSSGCFHYGSFQAPLMMSSGQCSPSDTLDSGTCSDLDGTPPPLPKKKNASTVILAGCGQHNRTGSLTSSGAEVDSDDNESNISCDSLNGGEPTTTGRIVELNLNGSTSEIPDAIPGYKVSSRSNDLAVGSKDAEKDESSAGLHAETKLEAVRLTNGVTCEERAENENDVSHADVSSTSTLESSPTSARRSPSVSLSPSGSSSSLSKASSTPRVRSPDLLAEPNGRLSSPVVNECTYEERKQEQERIEQESAAVAAADVCGSKNGEGKKYVYEYDRFYKFHMNELSRDNENSSRDPREPGTGDNETDECFAGYKILEREAIRSAKGTVRGVKNRVRAGIATFLEKPTTKAYKAMEKDKVVVYTTTSGIVRKTFQNCMKVKQILRTHLVKYDERDLFCSTELQSELKDRLDCSDIQLPQLFIDGQYIGDVDTVDRLNESGELRRILKPYKRDDASAPCLFCGDYQLLLCPDCNGSKRSVHRNPFTVEFVSLKCVKCNEFGFIYCRYC